MGKDERRRRNSAVTAADSSSGLHTSLRAIQAMQVSERGNGLAVRLPAALSRRSGSGKPTRLPSKSPIHATSASLLTSGGTMLYTPSVPWDGFCPPTSASREMTRTNAAHGYRLLPGHQHPDLPGIAAGLSFAACWPSAAPSAFRCYTNSPT
jgi:hypothetical protein